MHFRSTSPKLPDQLGAVKRNNEQDKTGQVSAMLRTVMVRLGPTEMLSNLWQLELGIVTFIPPDVTLH